VQRRRSSLNLPLNYAAVPEQTGPLPRPVPTVPTAPAALAAREEADEPVVISVGELDRRLKRLVEQSTQDAHVEGEISGLREAASGHIYFMLKDPQEEAAIDCVMYRTAPSRSRRLLIEGARVVLIGRATVYAPRGRLQFSADEARPVGRGALLEALERLKEKLAGEGLFAPERKRPLPADPQVIGVITSGTGAAIHDIVTVSFRRAGVRLLLARAAVQGAGAAAQMIRAIELLEQVPEVEVIILGRGGGSADDLSAFNDEALVRKVAAARIPVVSAVGHEIDVSLTDLAADARAATPSQAAEMLVPDAEARSAALEHLGVRMRRAIERRLREEQVQIERLQARLGTPERLLAERRQQIDDDLGRLQFHLEQLVTQRRDDLGLLSQRLAARHPRAVIEGSRAALGPLSVRLGAAMRRGIADRRRRFESDVGRLDALSPLAVLGRGYALALDRAGQPIHDAREVAKGDAISIRVARGRVDAVVTSVTSVPAPTSRERERGDDD
jgi:exodeoxyribonuclease VII large subunit